MLYVEEGSAAFKKNLPWTFEENVSLWNNKFPLEKVQM